MVDAKRSPDNVSPRFLLWSVVLSMVTGAAFVAALVVTFAGSHSEKEKTIRAYEVEQERVWGHHKREAPETIVRCAEQLGKVHEALKAHEREYRHPLVETEETTLLPVKIIPYLKDKRALICPADPTKGTHDGTKKHPCSYSYLYSRYWFEKNGGKYLDLAVDTPIIVCDHHPGTVLVLRHNGIVEVAPKGKYPEGFFVHFEKDSSNSS